MGKCANQKLAVAKLVVEEQLTQRRDRIRRARAVGNDDTHFTAFADHRHIGLRVGRVGGDGVPGFGRQQR